LTFSPSISVIVLNRDRIPELGRVLKALCHQSIRDFELIVVSNQVEKIVRVYPELKRARCVAYDAANVSGARNAGLAVAQAGIVAFCDDDAVPEPRWLAHLTAPFASPAVGGTGGAVRGRNGVSIQWNRTEVDGTGTDWPLPCHGMDQHPQRVLKTVGTNCAFRASALRSIGGFDEAYKFFLDEADVDWRLVQAGWELAVQPEAEVHHAFAAGEYRSANRVPASLFEIGASKAYFCKQHGEGLDIPAALDQFRQSQSHRLFRLMGLGLLPGSRIRPMLQELEDGMREGSAREARLSSGQMQKLDSQPYCSGPPPKPVLLTSNRLNARRKRRDAARMAAEGHQVTLLEFARTTRMLTVRFTDEGYWHHRGGAYGRAERTDPLFRLAKKSTRLSEELRRIRMQRPFT